MNNPTLLMIGILAAVAMLSAALVVPMQQASADDVELNVKNKCSDDAACSNSVATAITNDGGTASSQSQSQSQQQSQE